MAAILDEWTIRPASMADFDQLRQLAAMTGGGFTNLPHDPDALTERISWSNRSFTQNLAAPDDELYMLVLEQGRTGRIGGTACIFSQLGQRWPFYSYRRSMIAMHSRELGRQIRTEVLHLVNDYDGSAEVGGLFLHPALRTGGLGRLLARSRYLFIASHRNRFPERVLAELRGQSTPEHGSPFWDAIAGRFFGMPFHEADAFNARHGNQFIADMMPKYPVYVALLPQSARDVLGQPHDDGGAALNMLMAEGFQHNGYVDIFDGGPTLDALIDHLRTVREARRDRLSGHDEGGEYRLVASGHLVDFRAAALPMAMGAQGVMLPAASPFRLGEELLHAPF